MFADTVAKGATAGMQVLVVEHPELEQSLRGTTQEFKLNVCIGRCCTTPGKNV
jgi:hypothetical protein